MPLFGTLDVAAALADAPEVGSFATERMIRVQHAAPSGVWSGWFSAVTVTPFQKA